MRNFLPFFVLALFSTSLFAQIRINDQLKSSDSLNIFLVEDYRLDSMIVFEKYLPENWMNADLTIYEEETRGDTNIYKRFEYARENDTWIPIRGSGYYYLNYQWIRNDRYLWDQELNDWYLNQYEISVHNSNDRVVQRTNYRFDTLNNSWEIIQSSSYEYDLNDNMIQSVTLNLIEGELLAVNKVIQHVDEYNNIIFRKTYFDNDTVYALNPWRTELMEYDDLNRLVTAYSYIHDPPAQDSSLLYIDSTFWYNENESQRITYYITDSIPEPDSRMTNYNSDTLRYYYQDTYIENAWKNINYYEIHTKVPGYVNYVFTYSINQNNNDSIVREETYWCNEDNYTLDSVLMSWLVQPDYFMHPDHILKHYYYTDVTGIQDLNGATAAISAYPNPAINMSRIEFPFDTKTMIRVFDMSGKQLAVHTAYKQDYFQLEMLNLPKGILIVHVSNNYTNANLKLIKQ